MPLSRFVLALQFSPQRRDHTVDCFYVPDREPVREAVHPGGLQVHGGVESFPSLFGQDDQLRPPMMRVGLKCYKSLAVQVIDDALYVLTIGAQVAREPGDRLRSIGLGNRAENLPACARQTQSSDQPVARGQYSGV